MNDSALDRFPIATTQDLQRIGALDALISQAIAERTPHRLMQYIYESKKQVQLTAIAVCKIMAGLKDNWRLFGIDESWDSYVDAEVGISATTANNYARVWRQVFENPDLPEETKIELASWSPSTLVDVAKMAEDGSIEGHWDRVLACSTRAEVREVLREIRGEEATPKGLRIVLKRDGTIEAREGDRMIPIGWLNPDEDDELVVKATARIKNCAGLIEGA